MEIIPFTVDGKSYKCESGENLVQVLGRLGIYVPTLCSFEHRERQSLGTCRVCMVKVNKRSMAGCTVSIASNMEIEVDTPELKDMRKAIIELLFVEGNHFCPGCEKSGDCVLQALGYKMDLAVSRFPRRFNHREIHFKAKPVVFEHNRCVLCQRCTTYFKDAHGKQVMAILGRGDKMEMEMDLDRINHLSPSKVDELVNICPVGAILKKGQGFDRPYGTRRFDKTPVGVKNDQ